MEEYGKILIIAMPVFLLLIIIEKICWMYIGTDQALLMDRVSSISSRIYNSVKDVLGLSVTLISYKWIFCQFRMSTSIIFSARTTRRQISQDSRSEKINYTFLIPDER